MRFESKFIVSKIFAFHLHLQLAIGGLSIACSAAVQLEWA